MQGKLFQARAAVRDRLPRVPINRCEPQRPSRPSWLPLGLHDGQPPGPNREIVEPKRKVRIDFDL